MTQFLIDLGSTPSYAAHDFILSESNRLSHHYLMQWPNWQAGSVVWLYGPKSCGKTHLAHLWAGLSGAIWLNPTHLETNPAELVSHHRAIVLDDVLPVHTPAAEEALFHLLNHLKTHNIFALLTHLLAPSRLVTTLPDLASRLKALPTLAIDAPDDVLLEGIMLKLLSDRQLHVSKEVIAYALKHLERSYDGVLDFCNKLDHAALESGRNITLPLAREILEKQIKTN